MSGTGPARRGVLGCIVVLAVTTGCVADPSGSRPPSPAPTAATSQTSSPGGATATTEQNVAATRRFSSWLLHAVPMPPGAREWPRSPTDHFRHGSTGIGPSDPAFTRTTWWTVPLSSAQLGSWLRAHLPGELVGEPDDSNSSVEANGVWEQDDDFHAASTSAHTEGWVNFAYTRARDGVVVRVDTFVGARFARTVFVPTDPTSVTIRRTARASRPGARPHVMTRTITDATVVARLVTLVNGLPGAMTTPFVASCPPAMVDRSYRLAFSTPQGIYVAALPTLTCWPEITLTHDGAHVGPPLDPGTRFSRVADRLLR